MPKRFKLWKATRRAARVFGATLMGVRAFAMAQHNRLTRNWSAFPVAINRELRTQLRTARSRSRNLAQNDDYIKRYLSVRENNIPGPTGFTLQVSLDPISDDPPEAQIKHDAEIVRIIERGFTEWSHMENASVSGKLSFVDQQRLLCRQVDRDGESLVHRRVGAANKFRYALKIIDVAWLDEFYNSINPATGNRIIMSVEVDDDDRPVGYWLTMPSTEFIYGSRRMTRDRRRQFVPASEMIHAFVCKDDESQVRGYPETHTAGLTLKVLDEADFAELVKAHVTACNMGILTPPDDDEEQVNPGTGEDPEKKIPRPVNQEVQPGTLMVAPAGWKLDQFKSDSPNQNWPEFAKNQLQRACAGLDAAYSTISGDLTGANYSSLKTGRSEEQSTYRARQAWMIEHFNRIVGYEWLRCAVLAGQVKISLQDFLRVRLDWQGRGWPSIEPLKEIQATILAIQNYLDDPITDAAERGANFYEMVERLKKIKKVLNDAGFDFPTAGPGSKAVANDKTDDTPDGAADEENAKDDGSNRVLRALAPQLLPALSRQSNGQPIVVVVNQLPAPTTPSNGDSPLLG
jgi:lambda family phage portal protein